LRLQGNPHLLFNLPDLRLSHRPRRGEPVCDTMRRSVALLEPQPQGAEFRVKPVKDRHDFATSSCRLTKAFARRNSRFDSEYRHRYLPPRSGAAAGPVVLATFWPAHGR